ncbi:unnamed protein product [Urochloa humidicola]
MSEAGRTRRPLYSTSIRNILSWSSTLQLLYQFFPHPSTSIFNIYTNYSIFYSTINNYHLLSPRFFLFFSLYMPGDNPPSLPVARSPLPVLSLSLRLSSRRAPLLPRRRRPCPSPAGAPLLPRRRRPCPSPAGAAPPPPPLARLCPGAEIGRGREPAPPRRRISAWPAAVELRLLNPTGTPSPGHRRSRGRPPRSCATTARPPTATPDDGRTRAQGGWLEAASAGSPAGGALRRGALLRR